MTLLCLYVSCANEGKQLKTSRFLYHIFKQLHGVHDVLVLQKNDKDKTSVSKFRRKQMF